MKQAAAVFAGIRTQSWDVVLTERGPVFLEVNFSGTLTYISSRTEQGCSIWLTKSISAAVATGSGSPQSSREAQRSIRNTTPHTEWHE